MPIYEYKCRHCGQIFSVLQRIGEDGRHLTCPTCGSSMPEKVLSAFSSSGSSASTGGYTSPAPSCNSGFG